MRWAVAGAAQRWRDAVGPRPLTLREHAVNAIRQAIISGALPPGTRVLEEDLAAQLGISRGPVREAVRALEHEGLVQTEPHRGCYVTALSEKEIEQLLAIRAEVEAAAAREAATAIAAEPQRLAPYEALVERMRRAVAAGDLLDLVAADLDFHRLLLGDSGYNLLPRVWATMDGTVRARTTALLMAEPDGELVTYNAESHVPVIAALASGDPDKAAAAVRRHILETRDLWLRKRR